MMKTTNFTATHKQAAMPVRRQAMRAIARPCTVIARAVAVAAAATQEAPSGKRAAKVAFQLEKHVEYGEEVCLVGEKDLGGWDAQAAVCLSWHDGDVWSTEFELPTGSHLEYKYIIRKPSGEVVQWQPIPTNLELDVPESASLTVVDAWDTPGRCDLNTHAPSNGTAAMEAAADDNVQELPAPKAVVVASADDGADDDVVPAYLDDEDQDEWDGGASGGAANGILEAIAAQGVVTGSAGAAGKRGVVVAAAALASEDDDQGPQDDVKNKMPRTLSAVKRELRAAGLPTNGNKSDLFERLRQALTGSA